MAAAGCHYEYCIQFNQNILMAAGADEQALEAIKEAPDKAPLEDNERAMLRAILQVSFLFMDTYRSASNIILNRHR
jgi:hypothetical protein